MATGPRDDRLVALLLAAALVLGLAWALLFRMLRVNEATAAPFVAGLTVACAFTAAWVIASRMAD